MMDNAVCNMWLLAAPPLIQGNHVTTVTRGSGNISLNKTKNIQSQGERDLDCFYKTFPKPKQACKL